MSTEDSTARTWQERFVALRNIPAFLKLVWKTSPLLALTSIVLRMVLAGCTVAQVYVASLVFTRIVQSITHSAYKGLTIWQIVTVEVTLVVATEFATRAVTLTDNLLGDRFTNVTSLMLMRHSLALDLASFEDPTFYDKLERARRQTASRLAMVVVLATMFQYCVMLAMFSSSVAIVSPWLLLWLVLALGPLFAGESHFAMLSYSLLFRWTAGRRHLDYLRLLTTSNSSIKEIKIFGLGDHLVERSRELFDRYYKENKHLSVKRSVVGGMLGLLPSAAYYGAYIYILRQTLNHSITVGQFAFLAQSFVRCRTLVLTLVTNLVTVSDSAFQLNDLFDIFRTRPGITSGPSALRAPRPIRHGFEFRDVAFRYPGNDSMVLRNLNLHIEVGERLALVGENGTGKTTIVKLLTRLYDPTEGAILLDGVDLREYDLLDLQKQVGVIFQDFVRYDMPVSENIGFGCIERIDRTDDIVAAAVKSSADDIVQTLPNRYQQMLGRRFDGGIDLSGGQWQKMGLARAYMRDAQLLVLDEPTAALDPKAEYDVFQRFSGLTRDRTAVIISHRFSTVRMANRIVVLEDGGVHEQGTHDQLLRSGGRYAELFELQAEGYR